MSFCACIIPRRCTGIQRCTISRAWCIDTVSRNTVHESKTVSILKHKASSNYSVSSTKNLSALSALCLVVAARAATNDLSMLSAKHVYSIFHLCTLHLRQEFTHDFPLNHRQPFSCHLKPVIGVGYEASSRRCTVHDCTLR